jgi:ATP-dependent Clp protease adaptor protein ClpS
MIFFTNLTVYKMVLEKTHQLILKNDDENDYLFVIAALMRYCGHRSEQAEQCAVIAHNNGKCDIASGGFLDMMETKTELTEIGLNVELKAYESSLH